MIVALKRQGSALFIGLWNVVPDHSNFGVSTFRLLADRTNGRAYANG